MAALSCQLAVTGFLIVAGNARHLTHQEVLVIYNSSLAGSKELAEFYQNQREVPEAQVLGLELPKDKDISRKDFETKLLQPLRDHFDEKELWNRKKDSNGLLLPSENKIRAIVLMRGVPLRIAPAPNPPLKEGEKAPTDPISPRNEASVDSELALFGAENLPIQGVLKNSFHGSKVPLSEANAPYLVLVTRIDAPSHEICKRMITDAIATEKTGLWGRAYVDIANKFPQGDTWLEGIIAKNSEFGIPTVVDRFDDTLAKNYPLTETALYYGWYDWNVSGPFLNPAFKFRPGSVAVHIHSFSAEQLSDPQRNWAGPLLSRGAAATVGNVYEPYLQLTHHLDILHDRLLDGWTFAEAAWASIPVASWQNVAIGDPLYRPFAHISGTGEKHDEDHEFRTLRAASGESSERLEKIAEAFETLPSGTIAEGLALEHLTTGDIPNAAKWFRKSQELFEQPADKLRQDIQLAAIARTAKQTQKAISLLRAAKQKYGSIPETEAISGWLDILDPPPPPLADPTKLPTN